MKATAEVSVFETPEALAEGAARLFVDTARVAIEKHGRFFVCLSGGTTPAALHRRLADEHAGDVDWSRVEVFFGDERCVPGDHPDRNDRAAYESLLSCVPIPPPSIHAIDAVAPDGADRYEATLRDVFSRYAPRGSERRRWPRFDLVLLGIGADGHTASLFPGSPLLHQTERLVLRIDDAPKPPASRVTLTFPVINAANCVAFLATGEEKADAARRAAAGDLSLPAARVKPWVGRLVWLLDRGAGSWVDTRPRINESTKTFAMGEKVAVPS